MANVLENTGCIEDLLFLNDVAERLDGILSHIALGGGAEDISYIESMQRFLKGKYAERLKRYLNDSELSNIGCFVGNVLSAYGAFQTLISDVGREPEAIEEQAADILHEYLILPEPEHVGALEPV
ncbi:hypothetical protein ACFLZ7_00775 [Nanoarchaeota archaeon]